MRGKARNIVITAKGYEILAQMSDRTRTFARHGLTADQGYCMTRICEGAKCVQIASEMKVTPSDVSNILRRASKRFGTDTRVVACARFMQTDAWKRTHGS